MIERAAALRRLPSIDRLLKEAAIAGLVAEYSHDTVVALLREGLEEIRGRAQAGAPLPPQAALVAELISRVKGGLKPTLCPVINATGVIIHTNLGRAPLSQEAIAAIETIAQGYSNLEFDLESGERGSRHSHLRDLLARLAGAQEAMVVNNNASAVLLALSTLAKGKEVIVSRGQAVEIGGGFRIPDVMRQSGARLVEVGTTNRTYLKDYEEAIGPRTGLLLRVHSSNFRIIGFAESVSIEELARLGRERGLPVLDDVGSGALLDTAQFGLAHEPMPQESLRAGVTLACFSGDKLLGGPQAGIIVGDKDAIERLRRNHLARAVRVDKFTLAALQATLLHYLRGEAQAKIPVWQMISRPLEAIADQAAEWALRLGKLGIEAQVIDGKSTVGGGSLPGETLPTKLVSLSFAGPPHRGALPVVSVSQFARRLREGTPPVIGRIERGAFLLDPRTVLPQDEAKLMAALEQVVHRLRSTAPGLSP
ncbi:MAG: L-seryl-tRNA(Sec) selenium transferase [Chloroflexi bacterium]|nr:L-seryl-tRNA(Sec) selenium transferase [Chloroflexota bacterium]